MAVVGKVGCGKVREWAVYNISYKYRERYILYVHLAFVVWAFDSAIQFSPQSSLLQCLLRELKALEGTVDISGNVSYMAQTPWVFSGTVRDNILFGLTYNKEKYDKITDACALTVVSKANCYCGT